MVNFRFHLVSIVAVFLALGIGVLVGSTVVDQGVVERLEDNQERLHDQAERAEAARDAARAELRRWDRFAEQSQPELLADRLRDVPVVVAVVDGTPDDVVERAHVWLLAAGATDIGTVRLEERWSLRDADAREALGALVGADGADAGELRRLAIARVAEALAPEAASVAATIPVATSAVPGPTTTTTAAPPTGASFLAAASEAGFVSLARPPGVDDVRAVVPGTRVVVLSGAGASVPDTDLAVPLVAALVGRTGTGVVAAEAGDDERRAEFVGRIRDEAELRDRVSTVDDLERFYGQVALVLAIEDLAGGKTGHYGFGPGTDDRLVPTPNR